MTIRIDRIVTRAGDTGETSLGDGTRVAKDHLRIAAMGSVDEANATIGALHGHCANDPETAAVLARIQNDLFDLGADLCVPGEAGDRLRLTDAPSLRLEAELERYRARQAPLTSFVLPGGSPAAIAAHLARTTTRRAERDLVALSRTEPLNPALVKYLNRLSDLLFVLARHFNNDGATDVLWVPGASSNP